MDKNSSLLCLKFSLIAGNSAAIALGLAGFITGLVAPNAMSHLGVSGSQMALVSSIAVVIAVAGLIGAIREHICLLLTYALCILSVFIFRLTWSLTTPLHQSGRFVMDTTASLTLLSSLVKLFLMIFAILLALTAQNSLPLTKQKFLFLKDKLKASKNKNKQEQDKIDSGHNKKIKNKSKTSTSKVLKNPNDTNGIYVSSSHNIYESGRRRSPVSRMMNGHHNHSGSGRSHRRYPGVGYSGPTSPNESAHSSASQDSNNNTKHHQNSNKIINETMLQEQNVHKNQTQTLPRVPGPHRGHKIYSSSSDYVHYRSPSPPKPEAQTQNVGKFTNQPFFNPYRSLPKAFNAVHSPSTTSVSKAILSSSTTASRPTAMPRSALYSSMSNYSSTNKPSNVTSSLANNNGSAQFSSSKLPTSTYVSSSKAIPNTSIITNPTASSRLYSSSPSIVPTSTIHMVTTASSQTSIFTVPSYSASYQFDNGKLFGSFFPTTSSYAEKSSQPTTTNLSQTRNLFSTYTSPYTSQLSSTPPVAEENERTELSPIPNQRSYRSSTTSNNKQQQSMYSVKSPMPSPTTAHNRISTNNQFQWPISLSSSRTPTPPLTTSITSKYISSSRLFSSPIHSSTNTTTTTSTSTSFSNRNSFFTTPSNTSSSLTYPLNFNASSNSIPITTTTTTSSSTMSNEKYNFFNYSNPTVTTNTTTSNSTATSSSVNLFARVYPKTYEEYVKSYRYPESSTSTMGTNHSNQSRPINESTMMTIDSTTTPNENVFVVTGYNHSSGGTKNGMEPISTETVMKSLTTKTTTTQREVNEQEKRMIFYKQTLFHET